MARETTPGTQDQNSESQQPNGAGAAPGDNTGGDNTGGDTGNNPGQESGSDTPVDYKAKYAEAISHSREWEKRAKANKEAADELQQLKDAQKTQAEKQADYTKKLEAENAQYKAEKDRAKWAADIAEETGVPANLLRGSTREAMEAHAKDLEPHFATDDGKGEVEAQQSTSDKSVANAFRQSPKDGPQSKRAQIDAAIKAGDYDLAANLKASMLGVQN